jgi:exopolysaccharide transport family protein
MKRTLPPYGHTVQPFGYEPTDVEIWQPQAESSRPLDLARLLSIFRRWLWLFVLVMVVALSLGAYLTFSRIPTYTATGSIVVDLRKQNLINNNINQVLSDLPEDPSVVDTEVEMLRSYALAQKVVNALGLQDDPDFQPDTTPPSWLEIAQNWTFGALRSLLQPADDTPPDPALEREVARQTVVQNVWTGLSVTRSGTTNLIYVSYDLYDPVKAAKIANAFMNEFLDMGLDLKFGATRRVSTWLSNRLSGLRNEVQKAEAAVAQYRAQHDLLSTQGATLTEQEVSGLDQQLALARAEQAEADARLSTARAQLAHGSTGEDVTATLDSPVIQGIRAQITTVSQSLAELENRYGPKYPDLVKAKQQRADLERQLHAEIKRILSNLESQATVAHHRTDSISKSLDGLRTQLANNNDASVHLNELERNAESAKTLYEAFLERYKQTSTLEGMADADERIVSSAAVPIVPSAPKPLLNMVLALALGILGGLGAVLLAEALSTSVLTAEDIERDVQRPCLASIPRLGARWRHPLRRRSPSRALRLIEQAPASAFAEGLRALRNALRFSRTTDAAQVVAISSPLPREGKTTVAICLAAIAARSGARAVVVDCDLRRRGLSKAVARRSQRGLIDVLQGRATIEEALVHDRVHGVYYLPITRSAKAALDILTSQAMDNLMIGLRDRFDFVVLDTPPVLPVADATVVSTKADVTVLMARWRKTPHGALKAAVKIMYSAGVPIAGVALNGVNQRQQAKFGYGDPGFYFNHYKAYYGLTDPIRARLGYDKGGEAPSAEI